MEYVSPGPIELEFWLDPQVEEDVGDKYTEVIVLLELLTILKVAFVTLVLLVQLEVQLEVQPLQPDEPESLESAGAHAANVKETALHPTPLMKVRRFNFCLFPIRYPPPMNGILIFI